MIATEEQAPGLERRVVDDGNAVSAFEELEQPAVAPRPAHIQEHVVANGDAPRLLARMVVVAPEDVDATRHVTHDVIAEGDVFDDRPGRAAILVADGEED